MFFKSKMFLLVLAVLIGAVIFMLPRPEGTKFKVTGDTGRQLYENLRQHFDLVPGKTEQAPYILQAKEPGTPQGSKAFIDAKAAEMNLEKVEVDFVDGLPPKGKRFLAILAVLVFMFVAEPIPLGDHRHFDSRFSERLRHRFCEGSVGALHAPSRGFHHVLPDLRHIPGQGGNHQAIGIFHHPKGRKQHHQVHVHHFDRPGACLRSDARRGRLRHRHRHHASPHEGGGNRTPFPDRQIHDALPSFRMLLRGNGHPDRRWTMHGVGGVLKGVHRHRNHLFRLDQILPARSRFDRPHRRTYSIFRISSQ